jgi:uncharacterized protein with PCYCGC motif
MGITAAAFAFAVWVAVGLGHRSLTRAERMEYAPVAGPLTFPARVATASPELRALYEFAARRPDVLHYVPCFCGCGGVHKSSYDCFIDEVGPDGTVLIDDMSFT